jgi:hypothetical protein
MSAEPESQQYLFANIRKTAEEFPFSDPKELEAIQGVVKEAVRQMVTEMLEKRPATVDLEGIRVDHHTGTLAGTSFHGFFVSLLANK